MRAVMHEVDVVTSEERKQDKLKLHSILLYSELLSGSDAGVRPRKAAPSFKPKLSLTPIVVWS